MERLLRYASAKERRGAGPLLRHTVTMERLLRHASAEERRGAGPLLRHTVTMERLLRHASAEERRGAGHCCVTPTQKSGYGVTPLLRNGAEPAQAAATQPTRLGRFGQSCIVVGMYLTFM